LEDFHSADAGLVAGGGYLDADPLEHLELRLQTP
jgi:hypothetical protein